MGEMSATVAHDFPLVQLLSDVSWGRPIDRDPAPGSYLLRPLMECVPWTFLSCRQSRTWWPLDFEWATTTSWMSRTNEHSGDHLDNCAIMTASNTQSSRFRNQKAPAVPLRHGSGIQDLGHVPAHMALNVT